METRKLLIVVVWNHPHKVTKPKLVKDIVIGYLQYITFPYLYI